MRCAAVCAVVLLAAAHGSELASLEEAGGSATLIASGKFKMSKPASPGVRLLGESLTTTGAGDWTHVSLPIQLKWSAKSECLQFRKTPKVDAFFCGDDPAGEAAWTLSNGKLQSWGNPNMCLTTSGSQLELRDCASADTWTTPPVGGGFTALKAKGKCVMPASGNGPRSVKLGSCKSGSSKWKADRVPGGRKGVCSVRWKKGADGKAVYSGVPEHRRCFSSTGTDLGVWRSEIVMSSSVAEGFRKFSPARLLNHTRTEPDATADEDACAKKCAQKSGCKAFNFNSKSTMCELVRAAKGSVAPMYFDQGSAATDWAYYEPKVSTVNTKCTANCLPRQVQRIDYAGNGVKFGDSGGLLPDVVAGHFDEVVFFGTKDTKTRAECHANVDAITLEIQAYCQAAKTTTCTPDAVDDNKEKCKVQKETTCRRMTVMPTTFFSNDKAAWRTKCGHNSQEDGKVWHAARIAVDTCSSVGGLANFCGNVEILQ